MIRLTAQFANDEAALVAQSLLHEHLYTAKVHGNTITIEQRLGFSSDYIGALISWLMVPVIGACSINIERIENNKTVAEPVRRMVRLNADRGVDRS